MFRNVFALFSTLLLGAGAAASTTESANIPLEKRVESAQKILGKLIDRADEEPSPDEISKYMKKSTKEARIRLFDDWGEWHKQWHQFNDYRARPPASAPAVAPPTSKPGLPTGKPTNKK